MERKKILLLSKGYISNKIVKYWKKSEFELVQVSNYEVGYTMPYRFRQLIEDIHPHMIINAFGFTGTPNVDDCEINQRKCYDMNVYVPVTMNQIAMELGVSMIHISSGCVYNDESCQFTYDEDAEHSFGEKNPYASYYSQMKSRFERIFRERFQDVSYLLRIRMPFDDCLDDPKNYLGKILKYDKLVNYQNSLTDIRLLVEFIEDIVMDHTIPCGVYNVANRGSLSAREILKFLKKDYDRKFYTTDQLLSMGVIKCRRSNCVLKSQKMEQYIDVPFIDGVLKKIGDAL